MKKTLILLNIFLAAGILSAQNTGDTTLRSVRLNETVISANRVSESRSALAQQVSVLTKEEIAHMNVQTTADLIQNSGLAMVQKSQQGGGSPVLRGFEASRILLVVDGVRMNNAIYRSGHLQNIITMDNAALDRAEVLFGPASTVYGTDALGGAICFYTKSPGFAAGDQKLATSGNAFFRYGTVNQEKTTHADFSIGGRKLASITSFTYSDFSDLRMGEKEGTAPFFGKRDYYVDRINGKDSLVANSDPYVQKFSGYSQYDILQKLVYKSSESTTHTLNIQYSNSSDIPRYDRLTDPSSSTGLSFAEWYYGPQERLMAAYQLKKDAFGWFNGGLRATLSYQDIQESRHSRRFGSSNLSSRIEDISVYGLTVDAARNSGSQSLHVGVDAQYNDLVSTAKRTNINDNTESALDTRYPDGDNIVYNVAAYATHNWRPRSGSSLIFSEGLRLGYNSLRSTFVSRDFFPFPFSEVAQQSPVASGSLGIVWNAPKSWRLALNASSGFRVPNIDDLAKVFESVPGSVVVPNPDIKPEKTFNLDVNITKSISSKLRWENTVWLTAFRDAIVTDDFLFNGQDSIEYDGEKSRVIASQNIAKANLFGFSSMLEADVRSDLALYASVAYTRGRILNDDGSDTPLDHIPPVYGRAGLRYHSSKLVAEGFVLFNGKKDIKDYRLGTEDNEQYAPADGMPAWYTLNLRAGYSFGRHIRLQAGVDNLLDTQYRVFASGINGSGRNLFVTLRLGW